MSSPRSDLCRRSRGAVHTGPDKRNRKVVPIRRLNARLARMDRATASISLSALSLVLKSSGEHLPTTNKKMQRVWNSSSIELDFRKWCKF